MNPQEHEQLTRFLNQLGEARVSEKNAEADTLIREIVAKQPDSAYLLVQRALLLEQALNGAKAQITQLQSRVQASQPSGNTSFLGKSNPWAPPLNAQPPASVPGASDYQIPRTAGPVAHPMGGGASSFLGSVATTAAGVVAGSFLFQGIENLLGHHQSSSSWMGSAGEPMTETVINNYYETERDDTWQQPDDGDDFLASDTDDDFQGDTDDSNWV